MSSESRHLTNMQRLFGFMAHISQVVNNHAEMLDDASSESEDQKGIVQDQARDIKNMKRDLAAADTAIKKVVEENDDLVKTRVAASFKEVWDFLAANNQGIMNLFTGADASVAHLRAQTEALAVKLDELKTEEQTKPSAVATGPRGLAFVGLRADLKKLEDQIGRVQKEVEMVKIEANVAATAAGAAAPAGTSDAPRGLDAFSQLRELEESVEDRLALLQAQVDSLEVACPCVDGRCPCPCSRDAPVRDPPRPARASPVAATFGDGDKQDAFADKTFVALDLLLNERR